MTTRFVVLCTLDVSHAYYGGRCRDFAFILPADTTALLRRGRMLAKVLDGRLHVLFEAGEDGAPLKPLTEATLRIGLQVTRAAFASFTALTFTPGAQVAVYDNGPGGNNLRAPTIAASTGRVLTHALRQSDRPVDVTVADATGLGPAPVQVTAMPSRSSVSFDLAPFDPGVFTLVEQYAGASQVTSYYFDPEFSRESLLGIVEITIAAEFYPAPAAFTVSFEATSDILKYYVVASDYTDAEFGHVAVVHQPAAGEPDITFTRKLPAAFTASDVPASLLSADGSPVALFQSDAPVKRRAGGYLGVQLKRNQDILIGNLPQVDPERPGADLIVHLSKPKP